MPARLGRRFPSRNPTALRQRLHADDSCPAGPYYATIIVNDSSVGDVAWTNPDNAKGSDDVYATAITLLTQTTQRLSATGFGFQIAIDQQIDGILIETEAKALVDVARMTSRIIQDGAVAGAPRTNNWTTTEGFIVFGGATDLWGLTWTPSQINASNFGVSVRDEHVDDPAETLSCDSIRMTVYCSTPVSGELTAGTMMALMGVGH